MKWICLLLGLAGSPHVAADDSGGADEFRRRLERCDPKNAVALIELGDWCRSRSRLAWAERCYGKAVKIGRDGKDYARAALNLAEVEIRRKKYQSAYARLRELTTRSGDRRAKELLSRAQSTTTRKQRALVEQGDRKQESNDFAAARKDYIDAFRLSPDDPGRYDFVPQVDLLRRLARAMDGIDDQHYEKVVQPIARQIEKCKSCKGGFVRCADCQGRGGATVTKFSARKGQTTQFIPCRTCNRAGHHFCTSCVGLEYTTDDYKITKKERKALGTVLSKVRDRKILAQPLGLAMGAVGKVILDVDSSATLNLFRGIKPLYTLSKSIRGRLKSVPATMSGVRAAQPLWQRVGGDLRVKANFLLAYACEFAKYLETFDPLRSTKRTIKLTSPPSAENPPEKTLTPELLSAFPSENNGRWLAVDGLFAGYEEKLGEEHFGLLEIQGEIEHDVRFFAWMPTAMPHIDFLGRAAWGKTLTTLAKAYPFDVRNKLVSLPRGHRVTLIGRSLRNRLGYPRNLFEVWDVRVGFSPEQEKIYAVLGERVEVDLPSIEAGRLGSFLRWFGVEAQLRNVSKSAKLGFTATGCSLAELVEGIASALNCSWSIDGRNILIARDVPATGRADIQAVLTRLREESDGKLTVHRGGVATTPASSATSVSALPDNAKSLTKLAQAAISTMDYATANRCWKKIESLPESTDRKTQIRRERYRVALFHLLTVGTPASHLSDASEVSRIVFRNSAGDTLERSVRVLERDGSHLWVQPSYGGKTRLRADRVVREERITGTDWSRRKKAELDKRHGEVRSAEPKEKVATLLSLALFAKTNRVESRGTAFLEEAILEDSFQWLLETYFPGDAEKLTRYWRRASNRKAPAKPVAQPKESPKRDKRDADEPKLPPLVEIPSDEKVPTRQEAIVAFAGKHFSQGRRHLARSLPGHDGARKHRRRARDHFELARKAAEKLLALDPTDRAGRQLLRSAQVMVQTCVKDMGFFD